MPPIASHESDTDLSTDDQPFFDPGEGWLWGLVGVGFFLDAVLTSYGIGLGLREANPVVRSLFPVLGVIGSILVLKSVVVAFGIVAWLSLPRRYRSVIPLGLATPWIIAAAINVGLILTL